MNFSFLPIRKTVFFSVTLSNLHRVFMRKKLLLEKKIVSKKIFRKTFFQNKIFWDKSSVWTPQIRVFIEIGWDILCLPGRFRLYDTVTKTKIFIDFEHTLLRSITCEAFREAGYLRLESKRGPPPVHRGSLTSSFSELRRSWANPWKMDTDND